MPYDVALVCLNGHVVSSTLLRDEPEEHSAFCSDCGARTITQCQRCREPIRGERESSEAEVLALSPEPFQRAAFCYACGGPYPWTEAAREAAVALVQDSVLDEREKEAFEQALPDLLADTPKTPAAIGRLRTLLRKMGLESGTLVRDVLKDVITAAAKAGLGIP